MKQDTRFKATENMLKYGGGFLQSLAICYRKADPYNKEKLFKTFESAFNNFAYFNND